MSTYETSTTVGGAGEIHLAGVPFRPGTEVEVIVNPKIADAALSVDVDRRLSDLLAALNHAHNEEPIGPLRRDDLYERDNLR